MIKVKYEQLFPTASYLNCRIGLETEVEDSMLDFELANLKHIVNEFHKKEFPQFYEKGVPTFQTYTGEDLPVIQEKDR